MFRHHPDGWLQIGGLVLPLDEFLIEEPGYALPAGMIGRIYDPAAGRHALTDGANQSGGPVPWPEGDGYLANEEAYRTNYETRIAPPPRTFAEAAIHARERIKAAGRAARFRYITPGKEIVYDQKQGEARQWTAMAAPRDLAQFPWAVSRAAMLNQITRASVAEAQAQAVIDEWVAKIQAWRAIGLDIETAEERAIAQLEALDPAAAAPADADAIAEAAEAALGGL